uniref:Uncharacterized protein n=1 Tax=Chattonella marina TaxID=90936 RepID=D2Z1Z7_9STRA|nr:hypothetical protein [Chattonella marina]BAI70561.1 hypothetical protein [Chattonella marina]
MYKFQFQNNFKITMTFLVNRVFKKFNKFKKFVFELTLEKILKGIFSFILKSFLIFFFLYLFNVQFNMGVVSCVAYPEKINFLSAFSTSTSIREGLYVLGLSLVISGIAIKSYNFAETIVFPYVVSLWTQNELYNYKSTLDKTILNPLYKETEYVRQLKTQTNLLCQDYNDFSIEYQECEKLHNDIKSKLNDMVIDFDIDRYGVSFIGYPNFNQYEGTFVNSNLFREDFLIKNKSIETSSILSSNIDTSVNSWETKCLQLHFIDSLERDLPLLKQHILELNKSVSGSKADSLFSVLNCDELVKISQNIIKLKNNISTYHCDLKNFNIHFANFLNENQSSMGSALPIFCGDISSINNLKNLTESLIYTNNNMIDNFQFFYKDGDKDGCLTSFHKKIDQSISDSYSIPLFNYIMESEDKSLFNFLTSYEDLGCYTPLPKSVSLHDKSPCSQLIPFNWEDFI